MIGQNLAHASVAAASADLREVRTKFSGGDEYAFIQSRTQNLVLIYACATFILGSGNIHLRMLSDWLCCLDNRSTTRSTTRLLFLQRCLKKLPTFFVQMIYWNHGHRTSVENRVQNTPKYEERKSSKSDFRCWIFPEPSMNVAHA